MQNQDANHQCNHIYRVDSENAESYCVLRPEGYIILLYSYSLDEQIMCKHPSDVLDLASYVERTDVVTSLFDGNTAELWNHYGFKHIAQRITSVNKVDSIEKDVLKNPVERASANTSQEEMLFCANSIGY